MQKVLIRTDFNVPIGNDGKILDTFRIEEALPTIRRLLENPNNHVTILTHIGRPKTPEDRIKLSTKILIPTIEKMLNEKVDFIPSVKDINFNSKLSLVENIRFEKGEETNDLALAKLLASTCDEFVFEAFSVAHRKQASTYGILDFVKKATLGSRCEYEVAQISKIINDPKTPLVTIFGGAKLEDKIGVIESILKIADIVLVGGLIGQTFLKAKNCLINNEKISANAVEIASELLKNYPNKIILPIDVVTKFGTKNINEIVSTDEVFDIGSDTNQLFNTYLTKANTILWNGPMGWIENPDYINGTVTLAKNISATKAFKAAGGGETNIILNKTNLKDKFDFISTAGGAFLEYIEFRTLPTIQKFKEKFGT